MLPLFQFPKSGFYRSDQVGGPVEAELTNYRAFKNLSEWEDVDGDGQIIIGAEQYPGCLNPVTECANSSWYVWVAEIQMLPASGAPPTTASTSSPNWSPASRWSRFSDPRIRESHANQIRLWGRPSAGPTPIWGKHVPSGVCMWGKEGRS